MYKVIESGLSLPTYEGGGLKLTPFPEKTTFKKPSFTKVKNYVVSKTL